VIGRSPILGKPVAALLLSRDATVTICHSKSTDLPKVVRSADIVVAAVGRPSFVRGDWIKPGAIVIDAGYNEGNVGDVAFEEALKRQPHHPGPWRRWADDRRHPDRADGGGGVPGCVGGLGKTS
jgi:5,10-methylene-tetrahydrofolate dehydrogenase/methenyl tetrahydrofolate cyclohydrolase